MDVKCPMKISTAHLSKTKIGGRNARAIRKLL
jgi:hypothetical protein